MQSVTSVTAITGGGLSGDRYLSNLGFWKSVDSCEVTMISQEELDLAGKRARVEVRQQLAAGGHRRNFVVSDLDITALTEAEFSIGDAVFRFHKSRPPCAYLDRISGKGMYNSLRRHSGICVKVVTGGSVSIGDTIRLIK